MARAQVQTTSGHHGSFLSCLGRAGPSGCLEGWAGLTAGPREQEAAGQGEERGVWQGHGCQRSTGRCWAVAQSQPQAAAPALSPHPSAQALPGSCSLSSAELGCSHMQQGSAMCLEGLPGQPAQLSPARAASSAQRTRELAPLHQTQGSPHSRACGTARSVLEMQEVAGRGLAGWALALWRRGEAGVSMHPCTEPR